jgi:hypothetical protein
MTSPFLVRRLSWPKIKRVPSVVRVRAGAPKGTEPATVWKYVLVTREGKDYPTAPVVSVPWPQGCDQCATVILPAVPQGTRSLSVQRGRNPTTLYICGPCVRDLCASSAVPMPENEGAALVQDDEDDLTEESEASAALEASGDPAVV